MLDSRYGNIMVDGKDYCFSWKDTNQIAFFKITKSFVGFFIQVTNNVVSILFPTSGLHVQLDIYVQKQ